MRTPIKRTSVIGTAIGLVLVASAVTPAAAAPQPTSFTASSCSAFKGATMTGETASFEGVALRAGDTITTRVSGASSGATIYLVASIGLNIILGEGPTSGHTFKAPAAGPYNLGYSVKNSTSSSALTWSFDASCSTTTVAPAPTALTKGGKGGGRRP